MLFANPVQGPRIVPFGQARLPTDVLPDGHISFRITQRFADPDFYWTRHGRPDAIHGALDMGDTRCGDKVLAAEDGKAITGTDSAGAKYVIIDHGGTWQTRYWHLREWKIATGVWVPVKRGQLIGIVGDTGLGAVCHLHYENWFSGVKVDPWKYLRQNNPQEETMRFGGADLVNDPATFDTLQGARFRSAPNFDGEVWETFGAGTTFASGAKVRGASWTRTNADGTKETSVWWRQGYLYHGMAFVEGFMHELTLNRRADPVVVKVEQTRDPRLDAIATLLSGLVPILESITTKVKSAIATLREK